MGSGARVSQSIPVSQQAPWDVGVSAQLLQHPAALSPCPHLQGGGLGCSEVAIHVLEYVRAQPQFGSRGCLSSPISGSHPAMLL